MESGYRACFVITSLHPYIDRVVIDTSSEFYKELKRCQEKGLIVAAYTSKLEKEHLQLGKCIEIKYEASLSSTLCPEKVMIFLFKKSILSAQNEMIFFDICPLNIQK